MEAINMFFIQFCDKTWGGFVEVSEAHQFLLENGWTRIGDTMYYHAFRGEHHELQAEITDYKIESPDSFPKFPSLT